MKKILFITSRYLPNPSSNGINTNNIIQELIKRGHKVDCISVKYDSEANHEVINDIPIYRVSKSLYSQISDFLLFNNGNKVRKILYRLLRILRAIKLLLLLPIFPNVDVFQSWKVYKLANSLHKENKYDCIIGVFKPPSNIEAIKKINKKYQDITVIGYYLDLITSFEKPKIMSNQAYQQLIYKGSINSIKHLDFVLMAKSGKKIYSNDQYSSLKDKIYYVDFPTLKIDYLDSIDVISEQNQNIVMTFAGTLDQKYRNPEILITNLVQTAKLVGKIELNLYGGGNCNKIIEKYSKDENLIINNWGFRPHHEVLDKMNKSDFLINISNKMAYAVPSKIFEIFSFGKPIINLRFDDNDITNPYFDKYPSAFTINADTKGDRQVADLVDFINCEVGNTYDRNTIKNNFIENTP
ncbi:MAG: glycosyltransferase family 4 protein, partial [Tissierella sp.]|nr:glycosyltransferase family 4 protein [Tissierella sp.]